jgi:hypothetical protein
MFAPGSAAWSDIYTFVTGSRLGLTATGTAAAAAAAGGSAGTFAAVFAVDLELQQISSVLSQTLAVAGGARTGSRHGLWAYVVERHGGGELVSTTVGERLARAGQRLSASRASHPGIRGSAAALQAGGWPSTKQVLRSGNEWQAVAQPYGDPSQSLAWMVVVGVNISCAAGEVWGAESGVCRQCAAGTYALGDRCTRCPAAHAGVNGSCQRCPDGSEPSETRSWCMACAEGWAGRGGVCSLCDDGAGMRPDPTRSRCACPAGTYDSWQPVWLAPPAPTSPPSPTTKSSSRIGNIYCWRHDKLLTESGESDIELKLLSTEWADYHNDLRRGNGRRCVTCPPCVRCEQVADDAGAGGSGGLRNTIATKDGYAVAAQFHTLSSDKDLDVFKCPIPDACLPRNVSLQPAYNGSGTGSRTNGTLLRRAHDGQHQHQEERGLGCTAQHAGPLCGHCVPDHVLRPSTGECEECTKLTGTFWAAISLTCVLAVLYKCSRLKRSTFAVRVLEKAWPRFRQSFRILVTNLQILTRVGGIMEIEWPPNLKRVLSWPAEFVNAQVFSIPLLSCFVEQHYYRMWLTKMLILPVCCLLLELIFRALAARKRRQVDRTAYATLNAHKNEELSHVVIKLQKAYYVTQLKIRISSWRFMLVYLLYPEVSTACFEMLRCRTLDGDAAVLEVDYRLICNKVGGDIDGDYLWGRIGAFVGMMIFAIGIPLYYGLVLYSHRHVIWDSPKCAKVAAFRPLFGFYWPKSYLWEIWFMVQKVVLLGFISLTDAGIKQTLLSICVTMFFLCALVKSMPSKTMEYNYANIVSQTVILLTYLTGLYIQTQALSYMTKQREKEVAKDNETFGILMLCVQGIMMLYLIWVSTFNLICGGGGIKEAALAVSKELKAEAEHGVSEALLRHIFETFDINGDGGIEVKELEIMLAWLGEYLEPTERKLLEDVAGDDGQIDFDEFKGAWGGEANETQLLDNIKGRQTTESLRKLPFHKLYERAVLGEIHQVYDEKSYGDSSTPEKDSTGASELHPSGEDDEDQTEAFDKLEEMLSKIKHTLAALQTAAKRKSRQDLHIQNKHLARYCCRVCRRTQKVDRKIDTTDDGYISITVCIVSLCTYN